ncbi:F-box/FBD/LRR-repeat protein At1g13570-like [Rutidosis leptorrhynchoides]|uniref:F-box/FBD/LRR-repeat protein At1g13570-like n=1 Tax=Rutidosis leptorrhynchoides TaxID=125765 RepID=UPI003A9A56E1
MKHKRSCSDIISDLPQNIIETILCLVPIRDAVRTSVLSKKWRYNWTQIPKLEFDDYDMLDEEENEDYTERGRLKSKRKLLKRKRKLFRAIKHVLLMHSDSILECSLSIRDGNNKCVEIDQIIACLSRMNTVKKLRLILNADVISTYELPSSIFSFCQLNNLYLGNCILDHQPTTFNGFGQLKSLDLDCVITSKELILDVVSKSPLLKKFSMINHEYFNPVFNRAFMCELFGYMPAIEELFLGSHYGYFRQFDSSLPKISTPLVHLKYAHLHEPFFMGDGLPFVVHLIRSSPNMEKLTLECINDPEKTLGIDSLTATEYSDIWLDHLKVLELHLDDVIHDMEFLKLIFARSPMLKVVNIHFNYRLENFSEWKKDDETEMLRVVSNTPQASHTVKIGVQHDED